MYEEVADVAKLQHLMDDYLEEYNMSHPSTMNLGEGLGTRCLTLLTTYRR